uniref:RPA1 related single stranded DNA binding protein, X-linked n=1 Tax=Anolis carolinensis TaxID=28377 RepID=H9G6N6_ANOCA
MASEGKGRGNGSTEMASGVKSKEIDTKMGPEVIGKGIGGTERASGVKRKTNGGKEEASGVKGKGSDTETASEMFGKRNRCTERASKGKGEGIGCKEMAPGMKSKGFDTEMASEGKSRGIGDTEITSGMNGKGTDTEMASEVKGKTIGGTEMASGVTHKGIGGTEMASGVKGKGTDTEMASERLGRGIGSTEMASNVKGKGTGGKEMASGTMVKGTDAEMASEGKGRGNGITEMASEKKGKGIDTEIASEMIGKGDRGTERASKGKGHGIDTEMPSDGIGKEIGGTEMASGVNGKGTDTEIASEAKGKTIGGTEMASGVNGEGTDTEMASGVEGKGIGTPETGAPTVDSWIQRTFWQAQNVPQRRLSLPDAQPVTVLALERYLADLPPLPSPVSKPLETRTGPSQAAPWPAYYYDLTLTDGVYQERCHLWPTLNSLVQKNALHCGLRVKITKCFYMHDEKKLGYGFLCVEGLEILGESNLENTLQEQKEYSEKPPMPLKGTKKHYLPLWNNEDPCGEMWVSRKPSQEVCVDVSKLTSLLHLEESWKHKLNFKPLLVRIMHKTRLRYYGKPETKLYVPYQAYFEVADHSGMMSMVLWNSLCPEWYNSMKIGTVLLLEQYAIKSSYPFKTQPAPGDLHMKRFSSIEITLNVRDPPTKISIIPEHQVKAEWELPEVKYQFITRSELDNLSNNHCCDIIGLVQYVGRAERTRKKEFGEDFWVSRCVHVIDGTSEQPFILELFATSQPDIFEQIHPMTYLVCTQMRVMRDIAEDGSSTVYLTSSNETQVFITGWHKGQPYTEDTKVKNFIKWIKTQKEASHMERMSMGGYYPFPPVPDTFSKYFENKKVESILTSTNQMEKEIESLHYREHKRIAFRGIISAVRYVSCSNASQEASRVEPVQITKISSSQSSVTDGDHVKEESTRHRQTGETSSAQSSSFLQQQQHMETRRQRAKRKMAAIETGEPSPTPSPCSYFTRSEAKKIRLQKHLNENYFEMNRSQGGKEETTQPFKNSKEITGVPVRVQAERKCRNSWESALWEAVKDNLTQHLNYSRIFPESFPCKFNYTHKEFLMRRCNLQPARCKPKECAANGDVGTLENACPLEYYEVAILGKNHDDAVDVVFVPACSEDSHLFRGKATSSSVVLTHTSGTSCQQESINNEGRSEMFPFTVDVAVKAGADLEKQHVVCILDICSLGEDKVEVFLNKVYKITEDGLTNQTDLKNDQTSVR